MKKILVMGGGINQLPLLQAAKELGYYIVLCDGNPNPIGKDISDMFLNFDIRDSDLVLKTSKEYSVDGVVCNTESLMVVLAEVQTELGAVGNSPKAIKNVSDKYLFRRIQNKAGVYSPSVERFNDFFTAKKYVSEISKKLIMKPEMSSGSRGVFVIDNNNEFAEDKFQMAINYSRSGAVLIEEYVDFSVNSTFESEVFVIDGNVELNCIFKTIRDKKYNILPQCYISDIGIDDNLQKRIEITLQRIFNAAGISWGEYNVELALIENNDVFVIEVNARQGGMMLPDYVELFTNISMNKLLVSTAANDYRYLNSINRNHLNWDKKCIHYRVLADKNGTYMGYKISDEIAPYLIKDFSYYSVGDYVNVRYQEYVSLALLDFRFNSVFERKKYEHKLDKLIYVEIA